MYNLKLVQHLTDEALAAFDNTAKSELPQTYEVFARVMWPDDSEMKLWNVSRTDYEAAMREAFAEWRATL